MPHPILVFEFATIGLGIALFVFLLRKGERFEALVLFFAMLLGLFIEAIGTRQFHLHYYSEQFLFSIGTFPEHIPIAIGFGWSLVFFTTRRMANRLVTHWWLIPAVAGLLALSLDLFLDPMIARSRILTMPIDDIALCVTAPTWGVAFGVDAWTWCNLDTQEISYERWLGIPLANYIGWFINVAGFSLVLDAAVRAYNVNAMSLWRQIAALVLVLLVALALITGALYFFLWLKVVYGIPNLWVLIGLAAFGVWGLIDSGMNRTRWGFEWRSIGLIVLDAIICWYAFFGGFLHSPGTDDLIIVALLTALAFLLALWILIGFPVLQPNPLPLPFTVAATGQWSQANIEAARAIGDGPADTAFATVGDIDAVNTVLSQLLHSHDPGLFATLPAGLQTFITAEQVVDGTVDAARVVRGQQLFREHSGLCVSALTVASLPESYVIPTGARVLGRTQRLLPPGAFKRIAETAQYVLYLIESDGLVTPDNNPQHGRGIKAILRVRLIHAAIRHLIRNATGPDTPTTEADYEQMAWDEAVDGVPVNQMQLVYTLMTFCWVTLRAMRDAGAVITEDQANDYVYMWSLVGKKMGILEELLPTNVHEYAGVFESIKANRQQATAHGELLTAAALNVMTKMMERKVNLGTTLNLLLPRVVFADFVDAPTRALLRVDPLTPFEEIVLRPILRLLYVVYGHIDLNTTGATGDALKQAVGMRLLRYYVDHPAEVGTDLFEIPDDVPML